MRKSLSASYCLNCLLPQFQTLEVMVRCVRSINTMCGNRSFAIAVACGMEDYPHVVNALGTENKEICYIYSAGMRKNGEFSYLRSQHSCQLVQQFSPARLHTVMLSMYRKNFAPRSGKPARLTP